MFRLIEFLPLIVLAARVIAAPEAAGPFTPPVQLSVQCEWVRLPHATANALLRQHLKRSDSNVLHEAVSLLITNKFATRLDVQSLLTNAPGSARLTGVIEKFYATEYDPPQISQSLSIDGDWNYEFGAPACAGSFTGFNAGREVEVETGLHDTGLPILLNLSATWNEHLADIPFGPGISLYPQPLFYSGSITASLRTGSGVWQLAGIVTPPPDEKAGVSPETAPLPADRVLLFVRATAPGLKPNPPPLPDDDEVRHPVLAEWIEANTALINGLLEATPGFTSAAGLRASLDGPLAAGTATLVETSYLTCMAQQKARSCSIRSHPQCTEIDPPQLPQTLSLTNRTPAGSPLPGGGVQQPISTPGFFNAYRIRDLGTVLEGAFSPNVGGERVKLEVMAELSAMTGRDMHGTGLAEVPQPRVQILRCSTGLSLSPGVPALAAILDPLLPFGQSHPAVRTRKLLLFVTAIP